MAEKEYIDKKPIIHDLVAMKIEYDAIALNGIIKALQDAPAADVVEVVRCENCQHCKMVVDIIGDPHLFCGLSSNNAAVQFGDFCSYGERKEATP